MKNLFSILFLWAFFASAESIKISQFPLGSGSSIGVNDSFPYVDSTTTLTKRLTLYDLINVPLIKSTFSPLASPTFTGIVTAPTFVGMLSGNATTATALATNPTDCAGGYFATTIAANGNLTCAQVGFSLLTGSLLTTQLPALTGDVTNPAGSAVTTISAGAVTNSKVAAGAAIAVNKLAAVTASKALVSDASGFVSPSAVTSTELGYLSGATSNIQTQIGTLAPSSTAVTLTGTQTLTNKTLTTPVISTISNTGTVTLPTSTDTLVGRATTDTLTNKTLTSAILTTPFTDINTYTDQVTAPSNPAAGKRKLYSKTTGKFYQLDSSGVEKELGSGGGGAKNYIFGGDAESGAGIWATYKDAAGVAPVDGVGGVPTVSAPTVSATAPLADANSFLLVHPTSNTQGEGFAPSDFTIDSYLQSKIIKVSFDYIVSSGTFVAGSDSVNSDIMIYVYDVTNGTIVPSLSVNKLYSNSSTLSSTYAATFQAAYNSVNYRLIFHSATTTTAAFTLKVDSIAVSGATGPSGLIPKASTVKRYLSGSGTYNPPSGVYQIEVGMVGGGGSGGANGSGPAAGNAGASTSFGSAVSSGGGSTSGGGGTGGTGGTNTLAYITLADVPGATGSPGQYTTDAVGGTGGGSFYGGAGAGGARGAAGTTPGAAGVANTGSGGGGAGGNTYAGGAGGGSGAYQKFLISNPGASYSYSIGAGGATSGAGGGGNNGGAGGSGYIEVTEYYLGSNVQMSDGYDGRQIGAKYTISGSQTISDASSTTIIWNSTAGGGYDDLGAMNTSTGVYSFKSGGRYLVCSGLGTTGSVSQVAGNRYSVNYRISGGSAKTLSYNIVAGTVTEQPLVNGCDFINVVAGDNLDILGYFDLNGASYSLGGSSYFSINKMNGSATVAANPTVNAIYTSTAAQSFTNGSNVIINMATKEEDTTGSVTTGASWQFVAPTPGVYEVVITQTLSVGGSTAYGFQHLLYKNGGAAKYGPVMNGTTSSISSAVGLTSTLQTRLNTGDYITPYLYNFSGANKNASANGNENHITIKRVGN